jgi:hypothetical protein
MAPITTRSGDENDPLAVDSVPSSESGAPPTRSGGKTDALEVDFVPRTVVGGGGL